MLEKISGWTNKKNWSRNLHNLIHKYAFTLGVATTMVELPVVFREKEVVMPWPVLPPSTWCQTIFSQTAGQPLLSGHKLKDEHLWRPMLQTFWCRFQAVFDHELFSSGFDYSLCIPIQIHGDEGRGKLKRAVFCSSIQPLLGVRGHSMLSRLLFSILPGEMYAGDSSLDILQDHMVQDLMDLYHNGFSDFASDVQGCCRKYDV